MRDLIRRAGRYRGRLATIGGLALFSSLSLLTIPALAGMLLGDAVSGVAIDSALVVILLVCAIVLTNVFKMASDMATASASARILADLRCEVFDHLSRLPLEFHDSSRQGDLIALATYEAERLSGFLTSTLANVPAMLVTSIGATIALFLIDPVLAFIIPVLIPVFYIALKLLSRRLRKLGARAQEAEAEVYAVAESHLHMLMATKTFASEDAQGERYAIAVDKARARSVAIEHASAVIGPFSAVLGGLAAIFIIVAIGSQLSAAQDNPASLFSFLFYAALLTRPVSLLSNVYGQWQVAKGTLARLESVLQLPEEPGYAPAKQLLEAKGAIAFENVRFAYPGRTGPIHDASLSISPGEVVALVGENGCGKTTLLKLMLRLYEVDGGRITFDGHDITDIDVRSLRRQVGYVPQRALLFNGTIRENIAFGSPDAETGDFDRALALAQADAFVGRLSQGLETLIGDNGVRLSGGQRQRIALARAILADPPVLVFDEATSMWDLEGETAFVESCKQALVGRTVLLITHRPASLALADRIVLVDDGRCRELTPGDELDRLLAGRHGASAQGPAPQ
ncbi:ABC transporter ATP-binding protein [Aurantiacibacter hainanensis]|uniref:ABC transporter ATP-binding protein n=1 Tax=Aurantiacibacter hainanensis TaxID=3076114 RepID=UPI0030C74612